MEFLGVKPCFVKNLKISVCPQFPLVFLGIALWYWLTREAHPSHGGVKKAPSYPPHSQYISCKYITKGKGKTPGLIAFYKLLLSDIKFKMRPLPRFDWHSQFSVKEGVKVVQILGKFHWYWIYSFQFLNFPMFLY